MEKPALSKPEDHQVKATPCPSVAMSSPTFLKLNEINLLFGLLLAVFKCINTAWKKKYFQEETKLVIFIHLCPLIKIYIAEYSSVLSH